MRKNWLRITALTLFAAFVMAPAANAAKVEFPTKEKSAGTKGTKGFETSKINTFKKYKSWIKKTKETNPEIVGWLTVPGTSINEPIPLSTKNNTVYEKRDWKGTNYPDLTYENWYAKPPTASYMDSRTIFGESWKKGSSRNFVIYGHNWNNLKEPLKIGPGNGHDGRPLTMFGTLPSYTNLNFAKKNPYIYFSTGDYEGIWKVFSVAYCELSPQFNYNAPFTKNKSGFKNIIEEWQARSMHSFDVEVDENDRLLTLSTCTRQYNVGDYQRFIVVARLLRDGESENDKVKVTSNPNAKQPKFR